MKEELGPRAEAALRRVRATAGPAAADRERNLAAIEARLVSASGAARHAVSGVRAGPSPKLASALGPLTKAGLVLLFGVASGVLGYAWGFAEGRRAPDGAAPGSSDIPRELGAAARPAELDSGEGSAARAEPPVDTRLPPGTPVQALDAPTRGMEPRASHALLRRAARPSGSRGLEPRHAARPGPAAPYGHASAASEHALSLGDAVEMLQAAEAALRRSDALQAELLLSDLDRRAPAELLREERLATHALTQCALGRPESARAASLELEQLNPRSLYRARLEGSCAAPERAHEK